MFLDVLVWAGTHPTVLLIALVVGLVAAVGRLTVEAVDSNLEDAKVCIPASMGTYSGLLVGETSSAIYLGVGDSVVEIQKDRVGELVIGTTTTVPACRI